MEYRRLGNSELEASVIGLGANNFGRFADEETSIAVINHALDNGINYIDTADVYGGQYSERYLGSALKGKRSRVLIATKFGRGKIDGSADRGGSRDYIIEAVEGSLKRLQTDYIDLYQLHLPDPITPIEETLRALDELVQAGKIRYFGCSNFPAWKLCEAAWTSTINDIGSFITVQSRYNILERDIEAELLPCCRAYGVVLIPWGPLAGGFLTGKYRRDEDIPSDARLSQQTTLYDNYFTEENWDKLALLETFAKMRGHSVGELAIAWLLAKPWIGPVIAGARKKEQVSANLAAMHWKLTADEISELETIF